MRVALVVASLLVVAACSTGTGLARCDGTAPGGVVCARLDAPFDLRIGETAYVADTRLTIRADSVPEDSRCPTDVVCAWAGNARIALTVRHDSDVDRVNLNSTLQPRAVTRHGYTLELVDVRPPRHSTQAPAPASYIVRLIAARASD
jgi:hypothetical protein